MNGPYANTERPPSVVRYRGRSMWPLFQDGDILVALPIDLDEVRRGDCVLVAAPPGDPFVHRVVLTRPALVTKGDAHRQADDPAPSGPALLGRVVERVRDGRRRAVAGGVGGRVQGRLLGQLGRLDPTVSGRAGQAARGVRVLLRPLGRRALLRARATADPDGLLRVEGRSGRVLLREQEDGRWTAPWPVCLAVDERDAPATAD